MAGIVIVAGFSPGNKVPGAKGMNIYATGRSSSSLYQRLVLCVGLMGSGSTATANTIYDIYQDSDADKFGPRGELARMVRAANLNDGVKIKAIAVTPGGSAVAATATIILTGTWSAPWTARYRIAGQLVTALIGASMTITQAHAAIAAAFSGSAQTPVTATSSVTSVVLTCDTPGVRGNQYILAQDQTEMPSTAGSALAGGSALTGGAVPLSGGSVLETYTSLLAVIATAQYDRIALAANDATSLGAWRTHLLSQAGATIGNLEQAVFATNGLLTAAQSLSQSTLNEPTMQNLWLLSSETHPSELAASHAGYRAVNESSNPSPRYLNTRVLGAAPQAYRDDWPLESVRDAALNAGVTPLMTTEDGFVVVNRGITSYCKLGSAQDDRCLDVNQVVMPQYARQRITSIWNTEILPEYDHVRPNPGPNDPEPPAGVITPDLFGSMVQAEEKAWENNSWIINADANPPNVVYDASGRRLMMNAAIVPTPLNYQLGFNILQRAQ